MSGTLNKVMLIGHLGDEVKVHYFEGGTAVGRFPIATNETFTNKETGKKITTTEWHHIVVRNKLAELCETYLNKGDKVYCEGKIKTRHWEEDGTKRFLCEIHVKEMTFLSTKSKLSETPQSNKPNNSNQIINDDFPF